MGKGHSYSSGNDRDAEIIRNARDAEIINFASSVRAMEAMEEEKSTDPVVESGASSEVNDPFGFNLKLLIANSSLPLVFAASAVCPPSLSLGIPVGQTMQEEKSKDPELSGSLLSLPSHCPTPFRTKSVMLQAIEKREDGSSILTFEFPDGRTTKVLRRDCGDYLEVSQCKGLIVSKPDMVAAVGGIPDEMKIAGGISFSFARPTFMVPKMLPRHPTQRLKVLYKVYKKGTEKIGYKNAIIQAYQNALISSSSTCKQLEEEEARNIDQQPMVEVNLIPNCVRYGKSPNGSIEVFGHECGDFIEFKYYGVLVNEPGFVAAVGGVPDELKINGGISVSFPCPTIKVSKDLPEDYLERLKVINKAYCKVFGKDFYKDSITRAYKKARLSSNSDQSEDGDKAHNKDQEAFSMIEVNLHPSRVDVSGGELMTCAV